MTKTLADVAAFEHALLPVCMAMTARGLRVDDGLRRERIELLASEEHTLEAQAQAILTPEIIARLAKPQLIVKRRVCKFCRNGKKKKLTCGACGGAGEFFTRELNLNSDPQLKDVLYKGLKLPERKQHGKVTTDEEALQSLLALDKSGLVAVALKHTKLDTIRGIYERLAPAADGRVRTVFNVAGTYTGRFASAGAFYWEGSTNLQNLPAQEAARDPRYAVRDCIIPDPGTVFLYADLSQAEARVSAVLAEDDDLLTRWAVPGWDVHRWTASHVFGKPEPDITPEERFLGKKCRHALNYGMGSNKFWRTINADADLTGIAITLTEAERIWRGYHALHPNLDAIWWNRVEAQLYTSGTLTTCFGRRCQFYPRFDPASGTLDAETLRAAVAYEPQSTVADVLNTALLELFALEPTHGFQLVFQGHDSVLALVDKHRWRATAALFKRTLEREIVINKRTLTIPAEVFVMPRRWSEHERVC